MIDIVYGVSKVKRKTQPQLMLQSQDCSAFIIRETFQPNHFNFESREVQKSSLFARTNTLADPAVYKGRGQNRPMPT